VFYGEIQATSRESDGNLCNEPVVNQLSKVTKCSVMKGRFGADLRLTPVSGNVGATIEPIEAANEMLAARLTAAMPPETSRSRMTNRPLAGRANGNTREGRRLRDLFQSYIAALSNPSDPATQAAVLAAAELTVAAEAARARLLAGDGDIDSVVRIENLAARALRRLNIKPASKPPVPSLREYLARRAAAAHVAPPAEGASTQPATETSISEAAPQPGEVP
jgi:hypothetical protein